MKSARTLSLVVAILGAVPSVAQSQVQMSEASRQAMSHSMSGQFLAALTLLQGVTSEDPFARQTIATTLSFVGDGRGALVAMEEIQGASPQPLPKTSPLDLAEPNDAIEAILEEALDRQIVILNEAHHVPRHREFSLRLARVLAEEGFTYFAVETFSKNTDALRDRGYPTRDSGYYTEEPVYGDLVRQALAMDYEPIAYEIETRSGAKDQVDSINEREAAQCQNLMDRIFRDDPDARVFIHVGYSHATEDTQTLSDGRKRSWMAARLAEATGLDPLTIDQTVQNPASRLELSSSDWRYAHEKGWVQQSVVFRNPDDSYFVGGHYSGRVDMQVFHPEEKSLHGRPAWMVMDGYRKPVSVPPSLLSEQRRLQIDAFVADESDDAIPMDRILVEPGEEAAALMLPVGEYRIVAQDEKGETVARESLIVE